MIGRKMKMTVIINLPSTVHCKMFTNTNTERNTDINTYTNTITNTNTNRDTNSDKSTDTNTHTDTHTNTDTSTGRMSDSGNDYEYFSFFLTRRCFLSYL